MSQRETPHRAKRRLLYVLLAGVALTAAIGLDACGSSSGTSSSSASADNGEAEHKPVTLTIGWWYDDTEGGFKTLVEGFEQEYPWITVEQQTVPYGDYYKKLGAWTAAKQGPDTVAIETGALWAPYQKDLQPLSSKVKALLTKVPNPEVFCAEYNCAKGIYGVGFTRQAYLLYYNKAIFEAAGLDPNDPPRNFTEMGEACKKIEEAGKACWAVGGKDIGLPLVLTEMALRTATAKQMQELAEGKASWTDPEFEQLLEIMEYIGTEGWYQEGFTAAGISKDEPAVFTSGHSAFALGLIGDGINWSEFAQTLGYESLGVVNMPAVDKQALPSVTPGPLNKTIGAALATAFAVPVWSKHKEEAELLMEYALRPEVQKALVQQVKGPFPGLKETEASWSEEPIFGEILDIVNTAKSPDLLPYIGYGYLETLNAELQKLSLGETSAHSAAVSIENAANAARTKE